MFNWLFGPKSNLTKAALKHPDIFNGPHFAILDIVKCKQVCWLEQDVPMIVEDEDCIIINYSKASKEYLVCFNRSDEEEDWFNQTCLWLSHKKFKNKIGSITEQEALTHKNTTLRTMMKHATEYARIGKVVFDC